MSRGVGAVAVVAVLVLAGGLTWLGLRHGADDDVSPVLDWAGAPQLAGPADALASTAQARALARALQP
ncbi:MAG: hypothetical protein M3296_07465, partial [Actinomycetota bacterium]|nr:hypothetical protein [Actinomycetota bacterium]